MPNTAYLSTYLTKTIRLNISMLLAAMDTVTEARLAIALAQEGGIGFIHKNKPLECQAEEVKRVKKNESGVVTNPQTVLPATTLREVKELTEHHGFSGYPMVTEDNEDRVDALIAAGVDILLIDSYHSHSEGVPQRIRETRAKYPDLQIIGGNVVTADGALAEAGCSAVKVGIGSWLHLYHSYRNRRWRFADYCRSRRG